MVLQIANSSANVTINNLTSSTGFPTGHVLQTKHGTLAGTFTTRQVVVMQIPQYLSITTTSKKSSKILAITKNTFVMELNGDNSHGYTKLV